MSITILLKKMTIRYSYLLVLCMVTLSMISCKNWDDRLMSTNDNATQTLIAKVSSQSELSTFKSLLEKTGYDKLLASSKNFTVYAPTNTALASLSTSILNDTSALKTFVGNHIAFQANEVNAASTTTQLLPLVNGKYVSMSGDMINGVKVISSVFVGNGVLNTMGGFIEAKPSLSKFITSTRGSYKQNGFVADSIGRITKLVGDLSDESKRYTYFVLTDAALATEVAKLTPYYKAGGDTTAIEASLNTLKDFVIEGDYASDKLPATITSKLGVKLTIDKAAIKETITVSNGTVYVLDKITVNLADKFKSIVVEGENWAGLRVVPTTTSYNNLSATDKLNFMGRSVLPANLTTTIAAIKDMKDPVNGRVFQQMKVVGHGVSGFYLRYAVANLPVMKYKVYWVAVNDLYNSNTATAETATFAISQRLVMGTATNTSFPFVALTAKNYSEVLLGEYTPSKFGKLDMFLTANTTGALVLDYIRLEPVL